MGLAWQHSSSAHFSVQKAFQKMSVNITECQYNRAEPLSRETYRSKWSVVE